MKRKLFILVLLFVSIFLGSTKKVKAASEVTVCGDDFMTALELQKGEYRGIGVDPNYTCYYYINVAEGYELSIDYELEAENFFGNVTLFDSEENELVGSDEEEGILRWLGSDNGESRYYLVLGSSYSIDSQVFNIDLIDRADAEGATDAGGDFDNSKEITYGEYEGYLSNFIYGDTGGNDEYDYYKLSVNSGDKVTVRVSPNGDFFAGCAVYDGNRSELFNEEGLDSSVGEIIQESFDISQDGYIYIIVKWPYYGDFENSIDKYSLLITKDKIEDLGGQISTDNTSSINTKSLLILGFSVLLFILFIVLIIVIISTVAKKKRKTSSKSKRAKKNESKDELNPGPSSKKVQITVDEGTDVEIKKLKKGNTN